MNTLNLTVDNARIFIPFKFILIFIVLLPFDSPFIPLFSESVSCPLNIRI